MFAANRERSEALFREYRVRLTRFARHLVGPGADADDLVQETFLKAHHHLCNGRGIEAPLSFLIVTMRNLVNDAYRRKHIQVVDAPLVADDSASVERQVMSEQEFEALCVAIAQLPERMRYVFVLRKVYGYSCREIAEHLGRSTNTVREQVAQSFKKLKAVQNGMNKTSVERRRRRPEGRKSGELRPLHLRLLPRRE